MFDKIREKETEASQCCEERDHYHYHYQAHRSQRKTPHVLTVHAKDKHIVEQYVWSLELIFGHLYSFIYLFISDLRLSLPQQ